MDESESKNEKPKEERRFDPELLKKGLRCDLDQYEFLKKCAEKGDEGIKEWNEWRKNNYSTVIELEKGDFSYMYLKGIELGWGHPRDPKRHIIRLGYFGKVYLKGAGFTASNLQEANFSLADLEDTSFVDAKLEGAHFEKCNLKKASFLHATVDGSSLFWECEVNKYRRKGDFTDFSGVALNATRIDPALKQLLEYNIRRKNWQAWYRGKRARKPFGKIETKTERWLRKSRTATRLVITSPIRWFLTISSYGIRTWRILGWFLGFSFTFAFAY